MNLVTWVRPLGFLFCFSSVASCGGGGGGGDAATPVNAAPIAVISAVKTTGYAPLTLEFDGGSSSDRDGSISSYTWHTGDGNSYAGERITHTYTSLGVFAATLTVTDDDGAASSTSINIDVYAQAAGYYYGEYYSNVTGLSNYVEVFIGSDHRVYGWQWDNWRTDWQPAGEYSGTLSISTDEASVAVLAETWGDYTFPDGSQIGNIDFNVTIEPRVQIAGTYSGVGDNGNITLYYDTSLNQPKSLSDLEGTWTWSDGNGFVENMTVDPDGSFTYSDSGGCTFNGQFTPMDAALNEFDIEYYLYTAQCPSRAGDGTRKGLANINDTWWYPSSWLLWAATYMEGPYAGRMTWNLGLEKI